MAQTEIEEVTTFDIIGRKAFRLGVEDYVQGKPFRYDWGCDSTDDFHYERGRQYAAYCRGIGCGAIPRPRDGRYINSVCRNLFDFAYDSGAIR